MNGSWNASRKCSSQPVSCPVWKEVFCVEAPDFVWLQLGAGPAVCGTPCRTVGGFSGERHGEGVTCPLLLSTHSFWLEVLYVVHFGALNKERNHPFVLQGQRRSCEMWHFVPFLQNSWRKLVCVCFISHFSRCQVAGDELWNLTGNFSLLCNIIVLLQIPGTEAEQSQPAVVIKQLVCFNNYKLQLYNQSLGIHNGEREKHVGYFFFCTSRFLFPHLKWFYLPFIRARCYFLLLEKIM